MIVKFIAKNDDGTFTFKLDRACIKTLQKAISEREKEVLKDPNYLFPPKSQVAHNLNSCWLELDQVFEEDREKYKKSCELAKDLKNIDDEEWVKIR